MEGLPPNILTTSAAALVVGALAGLGAGYVCFHRSRRARRAAEALLDEARAQAELIRRDAELGSKSEDLRRREEFERDAERARQELREQERRLERRSDLLDEKLGLIGSKESRIAELHRAFQEKELAHDRAREELEESREECRAALLRSAGLTAEEARQALFSRYEEELRRDLGRLAQKHDLELREGAKARAQQILALAIQRYAAPHTIESTVNVIDLPSEEMKGRIIGREGRNIRAFERATGVDVIIDDTPGVVLVSGFDMVRREIAALSLQKLLLDGRIHPTRIEEIVEQTRGEIDAHILTQGREAAHEAGVQGLHENLLSYLGRLRFRTSYSQNVLRHSIEVASLTGIMADELGLNGTLARRCGLLHDIGKSVDHELEGPHTTLGADLARRHGEPPEVVAAAQGHHDDLRNDAPIYTVLVAAADAVSASRPGARRENLEKYVRRLEELEALACGFPGVEQAFAIQAGREIRIVADSGMLDDAEAAKLCRDIAKAVHEQLTYPGEVKVTVVRETRTVEFAR